MKNDNKKEDNVITKEQWYEEGKDGRCKKEGED
jgi:hypothetical protein